MPRNPALRETRPRQSGQWEILTVVVAYAVFAALWILLSDKAVEWLFSDPALITRASTLKGWLFVAVTSILLYGLMRRIVGGSPSNMRSPAPLTASLRSTLPFALLATAILALTGAGIIRTFIDHRDKEMARLQAIADLKARQIADWLKERRGDAEFVHTSPFFALNYRRWSESGDLVSRDLLQARLEQFRQNRGFAAIMLLDAQGELLWGTDRAPPDIASPLRDAARQAGADLQVRRIGPYRSPGRMPRLDFVVPLATAGAHPPVVVLHIDPADWLYPTLQTWPAASHSDETLLFRRDGDQIVFLNELRHLKDAATTLRIPLAHKELLAAKVLSGKIGSGSPVEGEDFRGIPSLGAVQAIAGTDWFMIAKLDRAEVYKEATRDAIWIGLVGLLALFMAAAGLHLLRQRQQLALAASVQQSQSERLRALRLLAAIADGSDDAIFAKDLEGRYILFNRAACDFVGKPAEDVLGRDARAIFPPEQAEMLMAIGRRVIAERRTHTGEEVLSTSKGERVFLSTKGPLRDAEGNVIGFFGISRDITERKRNEETVRSSEKRFHDIVEASADWIWEMDAEARYTYASDSVWDLLGYAPEEILGKTPFDLMPPEEAARVRVFIADIAARRMPFRDLDNINRHKDGSLRHVQTNGVPILSPDGRLLGYRGLDRDITEKKQAEEQLRVSEERLQLAIDATSDALWDWDLRSGLVYIAPHYYEMTGYRSDEITPDFEFFKRTVHPDDLPHVLETMDAHMRAKTPVSEFDYRLITRHGEIKWMRGRGRVVEWDDGGAPLRIVGTISDISARKAAEEALRRQTEELAQRNAELERFNRATVGRELDMIALKQQINALCLQFGKNPPYPLDFLDASPVQPKAGEGT